MSHWPHFPGGSFRPCDDIVNRRAKNTRLSTEKFLIFYLIVLIDIYGISEYGRNSLPNAKSFHLVLIGFQMRMVFIAAKLPNLL
jgi:hypothetical protein